jgi:hypothetical protein
MRKSVQRVLYMTIRGSVMLLEICLISLVRAKRRCIPRTHALVRQDRRSVNVQLVLDRHVVTENRDVLHASLEVSYLLLVKKEQLTHLPTLLFQPTILFAIHA